MHVRTARGETNTIGLGVLMAFQFSHTSATRFALTPKQAVSKNKKGIIGVLKVLISGTNNSIFNAAIVQQFSPSTTCSAAN